MATVTRAYSWITVPVSLALQRTVLQTILLSEVIGGSGADLLIRDFHCFFSAFLCYARQLPANGAHLLFRLVTPTGEPGAQSCAAGLAL